MDRAEIEAVISEAVAVAVAAAAGDEAPAVFRGLPLGTTGVRADLAIVADEFIGVAMRGSGDGLDPARARRLSPASIAQVCEAFAAAVAARQ